MITIRNADVLEKLLTRIWRALVLSNPYGIYLIKDLKFPPGAEIKMLTINLTKSNIPKRNRISGNNRSRGIQLPWHHTDLFIYSILGVIFTNKPKQYHFFNTDHKI